MQLETTNPVLNITSVILIVVVDKMHVNFGSDFCVIIVEKTAEYVWTLPFVKNVKVQLCCT